ncbi:GNAT family N-acetyltransferase [Rhizobium leguminosarum]|uniref:GNAT family N-acetyltransferase n=1 Tax=Rhizobium leguminosarum TaxID=384 RepID=UPI001FE20F66|nr:GNAT family N-acetyltransferase [Rhizobium leguminosarum]
MSDEVIIRELVGLDQTMTIFPLYSQVSRLSEAVVCQRLSAMFAQSNYRCIAAYIDERMVGASGFWTGTQLWCGKYIEADNVVVDSAVRSQGIGGKMMAWIEAEAERTECVVVHIAMVLGRERTHQFYKRLLRRRPTDGESPKSRCGRVSGICLSTSLTGPAAWPQVPPPAQAGRTEEFARLARASFCGRVTGLRDAGVP